MNYSPRADFYLKLLNDENPSVRAKAAKALGDLGDTSCLYRLNIELDRESDADVLSAIQQAIAKLGSVGS